LTNVLNPKAAVFFEALLPQFLPTHPHPADTVALALIALAITLAWFVLVASLIAGLRSLLSRPTPAEFWMPDRHGSISRKLQNGFVHRLL
jgi:threonine/homoserine/homoserine lactone efflux protein